MHKGTVVDHADGYSILDCTECGFIHVDPIPTDEELEKIYSDEYYSSEKPMFIDNVVEDLDWWGTVFDDRYDFFETRIASKDRSILDVGCGPGYFLKRGMERGWRVVGVEPSLKAAEHSRGLGVEVINSFLDTGLCESFAKEGKRFNAVHLSEVLEHTRDPGAVLAHAYGLLEEGGVICCVVPNDYNPVQKVLREEMDYKPYWLAPPHHINYFSFSTLKALMQGAGFNVIEQTSMFPMDFFLLMGEDYVGNDEVGRMSHAKRKSLDIMLNGPGLKGFKQEMYSLMARHGIGREMVIYAVKEMP